MAKYKGLACLLMCAFFWICFLPTHDDLALQSSKGIAISKQLMLVKTLEKQLWQIEQIVSGNHTKPFATVVPLLKGLREVKIHGTIYLASESAVAEFLNKNPGTEGAAFPRLDELINGAPEVRLSNTIYISCQYKQSSEFTINSFSHNDSKMNRFPKVAIDATPCTPFIAETHYKNDSRSSEGIFFGPGAPYYPPGVDTHDEKNLVWPTANVTEARCTLRPIFLYHEGPHNFQQLIRCFSWWQMPINKGKPPVLQIEKWGHPDGSTKGFEMIHVYYKAIAEAFNVRLEIEPQGVNIRERSKVFVKAPWQKDMETITTAYSMKDPEHAKILMTGMLNHYTPNNPNRAGCPTKTAKSNKTKPVIGFLDRQDARRRLRNSQQIIDHLKAAGYDNIRYLPAFGNLTFVEQVKFMSEVDILMGPHGAQFTHSLYMPECGSLLEFFPYEYYTPGWYGSLIALSGKHHFFTYNGGGVNLDKARVTKRYAINPYAVETIVPTMVERWESCCATQEHEQQNASNQIKSNQQEINDKT